MDLNPSATPIVGNRNGAFTWSRGCNDPVDLDQDGPTPGLPTDPASPGWDPLDGSATAFAEFANPSHCLLEKLCNDVVIDSWSESVMVMSPLYGTSADPAHLDSELEIICAGVGCTWEHLATVILASMSHTEDLLCGGDPCEHLSVAGLAATASSDNYGDEHRSLTVLVETSSFETMI